MTLLQYFVVRQLHREFLRAGANVLQTFSFYASDDKLENRGNYAADKFSVSSFNHFLLVILTTKQSFKNVYLILVLLCCYSLSKSIQIVLDLGPQLEPELSSLSNAVVKWTTPNFTTFLSWSFSEPLWSLSKPHSCKWIWLPPLPLLVGGPLLKAMNGNQMTTGHFNARKCMSVARHPNCDHITVGF